MDIYILHMSGQITKVPRRDDESIIQSSAEELTQTIFFFSFEDVST